MKQKFSTLFFLFLYLFVFVLVCVVDISYAKQQSPTVSHWLLHNSTTHPWPHPPLDLPTPSFQPLLAGALSFLTAAISSAGGVGGGGLFIPILTIIAGVDLKTASSYSAFMVAGVSTATVACHMLSRRGGINYDIALLSEPCMLLGVSFGVILNVVLPKWLITLFFAIFLAFCTFKTCKSGVSFWKRESESGRKRSGEVESEQQRAVPLLRNEEQEQEQEGDDKRKSETPWMKLGMLIIIWFTFFLVNLLRGQGIINIESCGTGYWIISSIQIPLALIFTICILHFGKNIPTAPSQQENASSRKLFFPVMALLVGVLGGVFGIGGGMLISPLLLEIGTAPQVAAATCSLMVFSSSVMSASQYVMLGMEHIYGAVGYAGVCFVGSVIGLTLAQQAVKRHGRPSLIVFAVGTVMAVSTIVITSFGAVDVWKDYTSGKSMGFKKPC